MSEGKRVPASTGDEAKAARLADALRANLKRRKAQARAKDEEPPPAELTGDPSNVKKP